jgi:hypothetical protein
VAPTRGPTAPTEEPTAGPTIPAAERQAATAIGGVIGGGALALIIVAIVVAWAWQNNGREHLLSMSKGVKET